MIQKLTSRKLWVATIGVGVGILMLLGVEGNEIVKVAGGIVSVLSALGYQFAEAKVDAAREAKIQESVEIIGEAEEF